jgi:preprotein translocase subunit SecE
MGLFKELFRFRRYKVSQGRLIRRLTMAGIWVLFATAAWKCTHMDYTWVVGWCYWFAGWSTQLTALKLDEVANATDITVLEAKMKAFAGLFVPTFTYSLAGLILLFGLWFGYRLVHWVMFADFLIAVEAEMAKVSWPGKAELRSSTIVVLIVFLFLAGMLLAYDLILISVFKLVGIQ